jgi:hypothetical protein
MEKPMLNIRLLTVVGFCAGVGAMLQAGQLPPGVLNPHQSPGPIALVTTSAGLSGMTGSNEIDRDVMTRVQQAQTFARRNGITAAYPNFYCKNYEDGNWTRPRCGTILLNAVGSEVRWVPDFELGYHAPGSAGDMFRVLNDWAVARGFQGALPLFRQDARAAGAGTVNWYEAVIFRPAAAEFRDVLRSQLGGGPFEDWPRRFRDAYQYAVRNGFVAAFPTGHQADYGNGVVYGTQLLSSRVAAWLDAPSIVYGVSDTYHQPLPAPTSVSITLGRHNLKTNVCADNADQSFFCATLQGNIGARETIKSLTNRTPYGMDFYYNEPDAQGFLQGFVGPVYLAAGALTHEFDELASGGLLTARLRQSATNLGETLGSIAVSLIDTKAVEDAGSATPYPAGARPNPLTFYRIVSASPLPSLVLDVEANSCATGARIIAWEANGGANQSFYFEAIARGTYRIRSKASLKFLDFGALSSKAVQLHQWERIDAPPQQEFRIEPVGDGYVKIVASGSDNVVDVTGRSTAWGTPIQLWPWLGNGAENWQQKWRLEPTFELPWFFSTSCH